MFGNLSQGKHTAPSQHVSPRRRFALPPFLAYYLFFFLSILFWELVLFTQLRTGNARIQWYFLLFIPAEALVPTLLCGWKRTPRLDRVLPVLMTLLLFCYYLTQLIYLRTFGSLLSVSLIGMGGTAITNFAWAMIPVLKSSVGQILLFLLPLPLSLLLFARKGAAGGYPLWLRGAALPATAALWLLATALLPLWGKGPTAPYTAYHSSFIDTDTAAKRLGAMTTTLLESRSYYFGGSEDGNDTALLLESTVIPATPEPAPDATQSKPTATPKPYNTIEALDFTALESSAKHPTTAELCRYYATQSGTRQNEYTGLFKGYNLIYICAESFSSYALDPDVNPTLCRLAGEGIILNNYYNSFRNTTTNGEFALLMGLWPDVSRYAKEGTGVGSMPNSAYTFQPFGLGTLFNAQGYTSRAYHNYFGYYYHRNETLPNLGYKCTFANEGGMTFTSDWPASDLEMMEQSVDDYVKDDHFNVYYMTFSGHGAYTFNNAIARKNYKTVYNLLGNRAEKYSSYALCYFACNKELDKAMEYLLQRLEEEGKLENTVIVIGGDHTPYYLQQNEVDAIAGHPVDTDFELYHDPCIIWCGGLKEPIVCDTYCCNVDILPTILNLFGIEYDSRLLPGTDIFSDGLHMATLYNKSFLTEDFRYNAVSGVLETPDGSEVIEDAASLEQAAAISKVIAARYAASLKIIETDFFQFAWKNSGLPTK